MVKLMAHLKVKEYNTWKNVFDSMRSVWANFGSKEEKVFKAEGTTNEVVVMLGWDTLDRAKKFRDSQEIKDAMQRSGVEKAEFFFGE